MQKARRNGKGRLSEQLLIFKHLMDERTTATAVAVNKRINRFKLSMKNRRLCDGVDIGPVRECDKIVEVCRNALRTRRHIKSPMRAKRRAAHPNLFITKRPAKRLAAAIDKNAMDGEDRIYIKVTIG